jgi:hypothetical protein
MISGTLNKRGGGSGIHLPIPIIKQILNNINSGVTRQLPMRETLCYYFRNQHKNAHSLLKNII